MISRNRTGRGTPFALDALIAVLALASVVAFFVQRERIANYTSALRATRNQADSLRSLLQFSEQDSRHLRRMLVKTGFSRVNAELHGFDLDSRPLQLKFGGRTAPLILYSIDPNCIVCRNNIPFIKELADEAICGSEVVGVTVGGFDKVNGLRSDFNLNFPVLNQASGSAWDLFPLRAVPVTILILPRDQVPEWWIGDVSDQKKTQIRRTLRESCSTGSSRVASF
jgi:hypothetical protein